MFCVLSFIVLTVKSRYHCVFIVLTLCSLPLPGIVKFIDLSIFAGIIILE